MIIVALEWDQHLWLWILCKVKIAKVSWWCYIKGIRSNERSAHFTLINCPPRQNTVSSRCFLRQRLTFFYISEVDYGQVRNISSYHMRKSQIRVYKNEEMLKSHTTLKMEIFQNILGVHIKWRSFYMHPLISTFNKFLHNYMVYCRTQIWYM